MSPAKPNESQSQSENQPDTTPATPVKLQNFPSTKDLLLSALHYAQLGWRVFPLHSPNADGRCSCSNKECAPGGSKESDIGKHPRTKTGLLEASTSEPQIRAWWKKFPNANIGIVTGSSSGGLIAIDIDTKNGGEGINNWEALRDAHEKLPETPVAITGSKGFHYLFKCDTDPVTGAIIPISNSVGLVSRGIDVRGENGYIVAAPSLHRSGLQYTWELSSCPIQYGQNDGIAPTTLAVLPRWLSVLCGMKRTPSIRSGDTTGKPGENSGEFVITEGRRNDELFNRGRSLRAQGYSLEAVRSCLMGVNESQCQPPLDPREIATIAASACKVAAGLSEEYKKKQVDAHETAQVKADAPGIIKEIVSGKASEARKLRLTRGDAVELAGAMLQGIGGTIVHDRAAFWKYNEDTGIYEELKKNITYNEIASYSGYHLTDKKQLNLKNGDIKGAIEAASFFVGKENFFDDAAKGLLFTNGFVRVDSDGEVLIEEHSVEHRAQFGMPFDYNPQEPPWRWIKFLEQIFTFKDVSVTVPNPDDQLMLLQDRSDRIAFLQEFVGACLMGDITRYAVAAILHGPSAANGKSVFIEVTEALFPKGSVKHITLQDFANKFYLAELSGMRLNSVNELPDGDVTDSDTVKAIISGDSIMVARKNQRPFDMKPIAGHMLACNALPLSKDQSDGWWRRFVVIPFDRHFAEHEREIGLARTIIDTELPGIAAWAIEGLQRLKTRGWFSIPKSSVNEKEQWKKDSDQVLQWVEKCTDIELPEAERGSCTPMEAYQNYRDWCAGTGHHAFSDQKFYKRLKGIVTQKPRTKMGHVYAIGITSVIGRRPGF